MVLKRGFGFLLSALLSVVLQGCGVLFETAMPSAAPSLPEFPASLIGKYYLADSIFIDRKDTIYNADYYEHTLPARDSLMFFAVELNIEKKFAYYTLKSSKYCQACTFDAERSTKLPANETMKAGSRGGYPGYELSRVDTIVNLKQKDKLKADGKVYYFNHFISAKKAWEILRVKADGKDGIVVGIANGKDREMLERFVVKKGVMSATIRLSDVQFANFVKQGGFRYKIKFKKASH